MEFDKSRVYTSLNADELHEGDMVIVANNLRDLKEFVRGYSLPVPLDEIIGERWTGRFRVGGDSFALAYLVERAENCTNCEGCEYQNKEWMKKNKDYLINRCENYKPKTERNCGNCELSTKKADDLICTKDGRKIFQPTVCCSDFSEQKAEKKEMCLNCKHYNKVNDFRDCTLVDNPTCACPHYEAEKHYRPFRDTDELIKVWKKKSKQVHSDYSLTMPLIWVREKGCEKSADLITCFGSKGITVRGKEMYFDTLFEMFEFLDGSPCGVAE